MAFSTFDCGNFFVIPGSPAEALETYSVMALSKENLREDLGVGSGDFVITIVGSHFFYKGLWLEHALVLKAIQPLVVDFNRTSTFRLRVLIFCGSLSSNHSAALEVDSAHIFELFSFSGVYVKILMDELLDFLKSS